MMDGRKTDTGCLLFIATVIATLSSLLKKNDSERSSLNHFFFSITLIMLNICVRKT